MRSLAKSRTASSEAGTGSYDAVLLPCNTSSTAQLWTFDDGLTTVSSISSALTGDSLAIANATLRGVVHTHGKLTDAFPTSDASYGLPPLVLVPRYAQPPCTHRDCQHYDPTQKWYYSPRDGRLRHALYTASIDDRIDGDGYTLTHKVPTWRHHCLAHVLSVDNAPTAAGGVEVWGGPLDGGALVLAVVNRNAQPEENVSVPFGAFGLPGIGDASRFDVRDLWAKAAAGDATGALHVTVAPHDIAIFKLTPSYS